MNVKKRLVKLAARLLDWKTISENKFNREMGYAERFPARIGIRRASCVIPAYINRVKLRNRDVRLTVRLYGSEYNVNMDGTGCTDSPIEWWSSPAYDRHDD